VTRPSRRLIALPVAYPPPVAHRPSDSANPQALRFAAPSPRVLRSPRSAYRRPLPDFLALSRARSPGTCASTYAPALQRPLYDLSLPVSPPRHPVNCAQRLARALRPTQRGAGPLGRPCNLSCSRTVASAAFERLLAPGSTLHTHQPGPAAIGLVLDLACAPCRIWRLGACSPKLTLRL
jgi:hypothetical protein